MIYRVLLLSSLLMGLQGCGCVIPTQEPDVLVRVFDANGSLVIFDQILVSVPNEPDYSFSYTEEGTCLPLALNHEESRWSIFADSLVVSVQVNYELEITNEGNPCNNYEARLIELSAQVEGGQLGEVVYANTFRLHCGRFGAYVNLTLP